MGSDQFFDGQSVLQFLEPGARILSLLIEDGGRPGDRGRKRTQPEPRQYTVVDLERARYLITNSYLVAACTGRSAACDRSCPLYPCRLNRSTQHFILGGKMECMQYFSKRTDLSVHSQAHPNKEARQLNERPRKTLGFETPAVRFNASVASTG